jgi:alkylated DNA repair dioxygenase AlkB
MSISILLEIYTCFPVNVSVRKSYTLILICMEEIPGLLLVEDWLDSTEALRLELLISQQQWHGAGIPPNSELRRRTQQYGHLFLYSSRKVNGPYTPIPEFIDPLLEKLSDYNFNHLLVNEYTLGQGIMPHIDSPNIFGPVVASISLCSPCVMTFTNKHTGVQVPLVLPVNSLLLMTGECRYDWSHGISKDREESGIYRGVTISIQRSKRISLTFRTIIQ